MVNVIKQHPYITGGAILAGGIVLYLYWRSGKPDAGATVVYNTGTDPQTAAISAQLQAARMNAEMQTQQLTAEKEVAMKQLTTAYDVAKYQTDAQVVMQAGANEAIKYAATVNANASMHASDNDLSAMMAKFAADVEMTTLTTGRDISVAKITATRDVDLATIGANRDITLNDQNTYAAMEINRQNTDRDIAIGAQGVEINRQNTDAAIAISGDIQTTQRLGITTAGQVYGQFIDASKEVALHTSDNEASVLTAAINARHDTESRVANLLDAGALGNSNRASVAASLLGDPQTATAIQQQAAMNGPAAIIAAAGGALSNVFTFGVTPGV